MFLTMNDPMFAAVDDYIDINITNKRPQMVEKKHTSIKDIH